MAHPSESATSDPNGGARRWWSVAGAAQALCWIALIGALAGLYLRLGASSDDVVAGWINSDSLYPVNLFIDTLVDGYPFRGWQFSIAPCWFPDLALVGAFYGLVRNSILATLLAGFVQLPLLVLAFAWFARATRSRAPAREAVLLLLSGTAVTLVVAGDLGPTVPGLSRFFLPQSHVGSLVAALWAVVLAVPIAVDSAPLRQRRLAIASFAALAFLAGMSNLMFLPHAVAPLTGALLLGAVFRLCPWGAAAVVVPIAWVSSLAGFLVNRRLLHTTPVSAQARTSFERIATAASTFGRGAAGQFAALEPSHWAAVLWIVACAGVFAWTARRARRAGAASLDPRQRARALLACTFALASLGGPAAMIAGGINGLVDFSDYVWSIHYALPTFLLPILGFPVLLSWGLEERVWRGRGVRWIGAGVAAASLAGSAGFLARTPSPAVPIYHYKPPLVQQLDALAAERGLRYGYAGYWQARIATLLSTRRLRVYQVDQTLSPFLWVSNRAWYTSSFDDRSVPPHIDFVLLDDPIWKIPREAVVARLGEPVEERLLGNTRVLLYRGAPGAPPAAPVSTSPGP